MLTPDQLALARSLSPDDLTLFVKTWQRAYPDAANGPVADGATLRRVLYRVLLLMTARLNAQMAATPIVHALDQEVADTLSAFYDDARAATWTSVTPDPVAPKNFRVGDILEALDGSLLPALIVSAAIPGGSDWQQGAIGATSKEETTAYAYYVLPYSVDVEQHLKAYAAASAMGEVLRTARQAGGVWGNGQAGQIQVNAPLTAKGTRFIVAIASFSCTAFVPYTPTVQ